MKKRLFSVFICLCMVVFTFPVTAFAQDVDELLADPVCTCATLCTEGEVDENCPVCSAENADLSACTGEAPADPVCTCETQCTEDAVDKTCLVCSADGADLSACTGEAPADPVCTCETQCTEDAVDKTCPVCSADGADLSACTGEAPADPVCTCKTQCTEDAVDENCPICSAEGADLSACVGIASAALLRSPRNGGVSIFIGGEELIGSAENPVYAYQDSGNIIISDESNYNFKWDGSTLSLRSAKILVRNNDSGIRFEESSPLTIELFGPYNTIDAYNAVGLGCTGIDVKGDLIMKAGNNEGSLVIESSIDGYNLDVAGKLTMESGTVVANDKTRASNGFVLNSGSFSAAGEISIMASKELIVNGGTLDAQGKGVGINVPYGTVAFNGGIVTISGSMGIWADGSSVSFGNSSVTINATSGCGVSAATASITGGNVTILTRSGGVGVFGLTGGDLKIQPSTDKEIVVETGNNEDDAKEIDGSPFASETSVDIDATYFHSEEIDAPVLYIGGVGFYSGKPEFAKTDSLGVVTKEGASSDDYTIQWDGDKTLTLNNANIVVANDKDGLTAGIYYCKKYYDLDINLIGINTVAGPKTENNNSYGVYATSVCNITGDGTLMVTSGSITAATESDLKSAGICSGGDLTITDAKIVAMGGNITAAADVSLTSTGIYSDYDFQITDGSIDTTGGVVKTSDGERTGSSSGLFIAHDATITNSTVEVISKEASRSEAFSATGIIIEEGSKVTLTAGDGNYSYGTYCVANVNIYDSEVTVTSGITADSGKSRAIYAGYGLSVYGGEVTATSSVENGQAIWSEYGSSVTVVPPDGTLMTVETGKNAGSAAPVAGSPFAPSERGSKVSVGTEYFHCKTYTSTLITAQPDDVSVAEEESATFRVEATGANVTYQWQQRTGSGQNWKDIAGATTDTYTIAKATATMNGSEYRCVVTGDGGKVNSDAATLTVNQKTIITTQPDDVTVTEKESATFRVKATGTNVTYQWQQRANSGDSWKDITEATADTYTIEKTTLAMNGTQYRCVVTGAGGKVNSNAATLTVNQETIITAQPLNLTVTEEQSVTFRVEATGANVTYQWQQRTGGQSWTDIAGATTDAYTIAKLTASMDGTQYRCVVTGDGGTAESNAATLTVNAEDILMLSAAAKDGKVIVSWEKPDGYDITGYELYAAEGDFTGSDTPILIPDGDTTSYTVENLPNGTALVNGKTYTFYLIALYAQNGGFGEIKSNEVAAIPNTLYDLTVENGGTGATVSGEYAAQNEVAIHAGTKENSLFLGWTASGNVTFADASSPDTTFIMPEEDITITATWHTHSWSTEWSSDGTNHWHSCSGCKETKDQAAHSFEWVIDQEATATQAGSKHEECTVCGYAKAKVEIPATGQGGTSDQPSAGNTGDKDQTQNRPSSVSASAQTGDESALSLWIALLMMSGVGLCTMAFYRKKHCSKK